MSSRARLLVQPTAGRYRWVILGAFFVTQALCYTTWYCFPVVLVKLLDEFGWSRASTSATLSIFIITTGLVGPIIGSWTDRFGAKLVVTGGALVMGVGLLGASQATEQWHLYLCYGIFCGLGMSATGWVPSVTALLRWFPTTIGTASGIVSAGIGVGILVLVPSLQRLMETAGWRGAFLVLGIVILAIVVPVNLLLQRDGPHSATRTSSSKHIGDDLILDHEWVNRRWTVGTATRTFRFWALFIQQTAGSLTIQLIIVHQAAFLVDRGYDLAIGALVAGIIGLSSIGAKLTWGPLSDRFGREPVFTIASSLMPLALIPLWSSNPENGILLPVTFALVMGAGYAVGATLNPALAADIFKGPNFGAIFGTLGVSVAIGGSLGPWLAGLVFDATGSYASAFLVAAAASGISILLVWFAAPRSVRRTPGRRVG
ncbi:MAG: MFS transporter [Chloroflexota bacterium]